MRISRFAFALFAVSAAVSLAAQPVDWNLELRLRGEAFDTPSSRSDLEDSYELGLLRARLGAGWAAGDFSLRAVVQAAAIVGIPENGAFGIGPVYYTANGEESPASIDLIELTIGYSRGPWSLLGGRMSYGDGLEASTGDDYLDGVKRARIAERLLGTWDWVNGGRRYDGVRIGWSDDRWRAEALWLQPLSGGVTVVDAYRQLGDLDVLGLTLTSRYGTFVPNGEIRVFLYDYDDERNGAKVAAGAPIEIRTLGGHLLVDGAAWDGFAWLALQDGSWGSIDHSAYAWIVEAGRRFDARGVPTVRVGYSLASGGDGARHETFFNMLPTNHKWYGAMDYNAFQNLRDLYAHLSLSLGAGWRLAGEVHFFRLDDVSDAWYGGSGAFDDERLGYAARLPAGGAFGDDDIGREIDLSASRPFAKGLSLVLGAGYFDGGAAAEEVFGEDDSGTWMFIQLLWKR